jgi:hypothetical protein
MKNLRAPSFTRARPFAIAPVWYGHPFCSHTVQVAHGEHRDGRRRYSFVDVLERVTDGVHVHIIGSERKEDRSRAEDAPERPKRQRRQPSHERDER